MRLVLSGRAMQKGRDRRPFLGHGMLQARRLGVPVISLKAATDALISGDASALPARPSMTSGLSSPGQQQQPRRRSGSGVGGSSCGEAAAAQAGRDVAEALVADSESFGQGAPAGAAGGRAKRRLSTDSVSQPRPGAPPHVRMCPFSMHLSIAVTVCCRGTLLVYLVVMCRRGEPAHDSSRSSLRQAGACGGARAAGSSGAARSCCCSSSGSSRR